MAYVMLDSPNPYTAQGTFPRRGGVQLSGTVILHTTEGNWQSGVNSLTNLVKSRADYGCYHQACDWEDIVKYYPWEWECWQDSETNNWAVGISAACKTTDWAIMPANIREGYYRNMAHMAADFVIYMAGKGIHVPLRRISGAEARARVPGFCAHGDSGIARSDPGAAFDWALFFRYTAEALNNGGISPQGTITSEEDELANAEERIIEAINFAFSRSEKEFPAANAKAILEAPVKYRDPLTGAETEQTTNLATVVAFRDFNDVQNRLATGTPQQIVSAIPKEIAAEVVKLLTERLAK